MKSPDSDGVTVKRKAGRGSSAKQLPEGMRLLRLSTENGEWSLYWRGDGQLILDTPDKTDTVCDESGYYRQMRRRRFVSQDEALVHLLLAAVPHALLEPLKPLLLKLAPERYQESVKAWLCGPSPSRFEESVKKALSKAA